MEKMKLYPITMNSRTQPPVFPPPLSVPEMPSGPTIYLRVYIETEDSSKEFSLPENLEVLKSTMPAEVEDFYIFYGTPGLDALEDAIEEMEDDENSIKSNAIKILGDYRKDIEKRAEKACEIIEKKAAEIALMKLEDSINEILDEAVRYLSGVSNRSVAASLLLSGTPTWELTEGAGNSMIKALVELRDLRNKAENDAQKWTKLNNSFEPVSIRDVQNAEQTAQESLQNVIETTAAYCLQYPIIHRLQFSPNLPFYREDTQFFLTAKDRIQAFKSQLFNILKNSFIDARDIWKDIKEDSSLVWKYRPLLEETLDELNQDDTSFAGRAANERMANVNYLINWIEYAELVAVGAQIVALVASPAPPVALTISVAATALGIGSMVLKAYEKYKQEKVANAALDPTLSLIGEPEWGYFLFDVAIEVLSSFSKVPTSVIVGLMAGQSLLELQE